jgi:hypothetical protein
MSKLVLLDDEVLDEVFEIVLTMAPYNGDVTIFVVPRTRELVAKANALAKKNPLYNRHTVIEDGKRVVRDGNPGEAQAQELAKLLVRDWRGVVDRHGVDVPCTEETKVILFRNPDVANYVVLRAGEVAVYDAEIDEGNSES